VIWQKLNFEIESSGVDSYWSLWLGDLKNAKKIYPEHHVTW